MANARQRRRVPAGAAHRRDRADLAVTGAAVTGAAIRRSGMRTGAAPR